MNSIHRIVAVVIVLVNITLTPVLLHAQTEQVPHSATLQLKNDTKARITICDIFVVRIPNQVVIDQQNPIELLAGATITFSLPAGVYHLLVTDCDQNTLIDQPNQAIYDTVIAMLPQMSVATLVIVNRTNQVICALYVADTNASAWGNNLLQKQVIAPNDSYTLHPSTSEHHIRMDDCAGNTLFDQRNVLIKAQHQIDVTELDVATAKCDMQAQQWEGFYQERQYESAQQILVEALQCYEAVHDLRQVGVVRNNLGLVYHSQGLLDEAMVEFQKALTIADQTNNQAQVAVTLANIANIYAAQGRNQESLEQNLSALRALRDSNSRIDEGAILNNIGLNYQALGRHEEAMSYYEQALVIRTQIDDKVGEAETRNNIAELYLYWGQYDKALSYYKQALTILSKTHNRSSEAIIIHNIGGLYEAQGRYLEALTQYQQAAETLHNLGDPHGEALSLHNIGALYLVQGNYTNALQNLEQARSLLHKLGDRGAESITINSIADVYQAQGNYSVAQQYLQQALTIQHTVNNRVAIGAILNNIGTLYLDQGRYDEALTKFKEALRVRQEANDLIGEGATLNNIGSVYLSQGRTEEALQQLESALQIRSQIGDHQGEISTLTNIGGALLDQGLYEKALERYSAALKIATDLNSRSEEATLLNNIGNIYFSQRLYDDALTQYTQALAIRENIGDLVGKGLTYDNIANVYESTGLLTKAIENYSTGIGLWESVRSTAGNDSSRSSFVERYITAYDRIIALYVRQHEVAQAFWYSERGRARSLLDALTTGQISLNDDRSAELLAQEQDTYTLRQSAKDRLTEVRAASPPNPQSVTQAEQTVKEAEVAYEQVTAAIAARSDQLTDLIPGRQHVPQLAEVQKLLDDQTTLLSYWTLDDKTLAFIISASDPPTVIELPAATPEKIQTKLESLYARYQATRPQVSGDEYPRELQDLYFWLVKPLAPYLKTNHIAIVPHQLLHYVPFAALVDETQLELAPTKRQAYFGQQHTLTLLPSASSLTYLAKNAALATSNSSSTTKPSTAIEALVLGNPSTKEAGLLPLTHAAAEAQAVADLLETQVYTGALATESRVKTSPGVRILHLAAHGIYNQNNALYSALYLTSSGTDDGKLETHEVFGLPLKGNDIVVLSACQTNLGDLSGGDDIVGLTRAFFFAGAPTVISSLWNVNDEATETLMVAFYRHWLQEGMSKAHALQAAQADVRNAGRESPFYWAGFVLNGDPGNRK